jgi:hypothetical protein
LISMAALVMLSHHTTRVIREAIEIRLHKFQNRRGYPISPA